MRIFVVDGREVPDPDPSLTVEEVRESMSAFFPELSNATTTERKDGEKTYIEFRKTVGTKGER
ncbi:MAG: PRTRC system protein C [Dehalococcoidia bacterium]|nr:PRTRC system protein C [Dehalococcoidia bacterium]